LSRNPNSDVWWAPPCWKASLCSNLQSWCLDLSMYMHEVWLFQRTCMKSGSFHVHAWSLAFSTLMHEHIIYFSGMFHTDTE
jgi:hypothetical protein